MEKELIIGNEYTIMTASWNYRGEFLGFDYDGEAMFKDEYGDKFYINLANPENIVS